MNNNVTPVILMYHGIIADDASLPLTREIGAEIYDVRFKDFYAQMNYLKNTGGAATITFDDGELNNYDHAFRVLKEFGLTAHFFIIVKRVGKDGYMGWGQIKELMEAGMAIGSHGLTHETLTNLTQTQMEEELRASKETMEANLGVRITSLSIPRGFCNDRIIDAARGLGYENIFISDKPYHVQLECLPRTAVKGYWTLKRFQQALDGRVPFRESFSNLIKKTAKTILRESGYNLLRNLVIRYLK